MIIPMLCVTIFVILVVWFLLPRVARLMIHTPTAISIFVCLSMVDRKSGSAGMPRPISYAVFCLKKKKLSGNWWDEKPWSRAEYAIQLKNLPADATSLQSDDALVCTD